MKVEPDTISVMNALAGSMFFVSLFLWLMFPTIPGLAVAIVVIGLTVLLDYNFKEHVRSAIKGFALGSIPIIFASAIAYVILYFFIKMMLAYLFGGGGSIGTF